MPIGVREGGNPKLQVFWAYLKPTKNISPLKQTNIKKTCHLENAPASAFGHIVLFFWNRRRTPSVRRRFTTQANGDILHEGIMLFGGRRLRERSVIFFCIFVWFGWNGNNNNNNNHNNNPEAKHFRKPRQTLFYHVFQTQFKNEYIVEATKQARMNNVVVLNHILLKVR